MSLGNRFLLFVGVPTLLAAIYLLLWAADMYVSEARFALRGPENSGTPELFAFFSPGGGSAATDAYVVQDYVRSWGLLDILDKHLALRKHYRVDKADLFSRLSADATAEEFLDYYRERVKVTYDPTTGIFALSARAYEPEMARALGQAILEQSEELVNRLRERALHDALSLARSELALAEERLTQSREALKLFRKEHNLLNPEATAGATLALVADLEGEGAKTRTQLAEARSYLREDSAQVSALKARIAALDGQARVEKARLTGGGGTVMNDLVADYERLMVEREFAEKQYVSALASLEAARVRAEGQSRYLVAYSPPTLPQKATWPRRFTFIGLVFVVASLLFGIVSLVIAAIREHAGF